MDTSMSAIEFYMNLPHDNSGSISKNRFRNELLWGIQKAFEIYKTGADFVVVFDLACDIEVHVGDAFEFYQIKTHRGRKAYTVTEIINKGQSTQSILGKLYLLKKHAIDEDKSVKVSIVSNIPLQDVKAKKIFSDRESVSLEELCEESKELIRVQLKDEINCCHKIIFADVYYEYTLMNLFNPNDEFIGKTVTFYLSIKNREPKKPNALFESIKSIVESKACHESTEISYANIIEKKGLTRQELTEILDKYSENTDEAVSKVFAYISNNYAKFNEKVKMKAAISNIVNDRTSTRIIQDLERDIFEYIKSNIDSFSGGYEDTCKILSKRFSKRFPVEYDKYYRKAFFLLSLFFYEEKIDAHSNH